MRRPAPRRAARAERLAGHPPHHHDRGAVLGPAGERSRREAGRVRGEELQPRLLGLGLGGLPRHVPLADDVSVDRELVGVHRCGGQTSNWPASRRSLTSVRNRPRRRRRRAGGRRSARGRPSSGSRSISPRSASSMTTGRLTTAPVPRIADLRLVDDRGVEQRAAAAGVGERERAAGQLVRADLVGRGCARRGRRSCWARPAMLRSPASWITGTSRPRSVSTAIAEVLARRGR